MKNDIKIMIDYYHNQNKGGIHNYTTNNSFVAHTATLSKTFKTLKGSQKFMEKWGYKPIK